MWIPKLVKCQRGQSIVEFTLAAPLFFAAFYAIVEFSHLFYVRVTVQHALDEAGRYMSTGQGQSSTDANARLQKIYDTFCANLIATGLSCSDIQPHFTVNNSPVTVGGRSQTVRITTTFTKPFFGGTFRLIAPLFPSSITMTVSTLYKNEPYTEVSVGG
jgi:Flp pilus assembly protein TadG